jgi:hypothetical protein
LEPVVQLPLLLAERRRRRNKHPKNNNPRRRRNLRRRKSLKLKRLMRIWEICSDDVIELFKLAFIQEVKF